MTEGWTLLHGGALGDLCLALKLALRLPGIRTGAKLRVVSRVCPGDLTQCRPPIERISSDGIGLHTLYAAASDQPLPGGRGPACRESSLASLFAGRRVLNMLDAKLADGLRELGAVRVVSLDPRPDVVESAPRPDVSDAGFAAPLHITEQWRRRIEAQGVSLHVCARGRAARDCLTPTPAVVDAGRAVLGAGAHETILLHPGAGGDAKRWPLECFRLLAERLREQGGRVAFVVGPVELESWPVATLDALGRVVPLLRCESSRQLLTLLSAAALLVSNDSGPAHLAALLGRPTLTLFGPTDSNVWRPLGAVANVLVGEPDRGPDWGLAPAHVAKVAMSWRTMRPPS